MKMVVLNFSFGVLILLGLTFNSVAQSPTSDPSSPQTRRFRLIGIDEFNKIAADLRKEDVEVRVNGNIYTKFLISVKPAPLLYILSLDNSGSMRFHFDKIISASETIIDQNSNDDATLLMSFVDIKKIRITGKFTSDKVFLRKNLNKFEISGGRTALIEAIYKSIEILAGQKGLPGHQRLLIIISDGEDRGSIRSEDQLFELLRKEKIPVLFIGLLEDLEKRRTFVRTSPRKRAVSFINNVVEASGGVAIFPKKAKNLSLFADQILSGIRNQIFVVVDLPRDVKNIRIQPSKLGTKKHLKFLVKTKY